MTFEQHIAKAQEYIATIKAGNISAAWETVLRNLCEEQIVLAEIAKLRALGF
jgi:hypothetical protein